MILLAPHNDDEALFCAYTCMREKPLVLLITDSWIQPNRGDRGCDWQTRRAETQKAMDLLGCEVRFLGIKDTELTEDNLKEALKPYVNEKCLAPALQGGNLQHDLVARVATELFKDIKYYTTYTKTELWTKGDVEIRPTQKEIDLKNEALSMYQSQLHLGSTRPHFLAVLGKSEWVKNSL